MDGAIVGRGVEGSGSASGDSFASTPEQMMIMQTRSYEVKYDDDNDDQRRLRGNSIS